MTKFKSNLWNKGKITSVFGLIVLGFTTHGVFITEDLPLIWTGLAAYGLGLLAFIMADDIITPIKQIIKKLTNGKTEA